MHILTCPCCGPRDQTEFRYGGDASRQFPDLAAPQEEWYAYIYLRDNPKGWHAEYWWHEYGCRQWLKVRRNTLTHAIDACCFASDTLPPLSENPAQKAAKGAA